MKHRMTLTDEAEPISSRSSIHEIAVVPPDLVGAHCSNMLTHLLELGLHNWGMAIALPVVFG